MQQRIIEMALEGIAEKRARSKNRKVTWAGSRWFQTCHDRKESEGSWKYEDAKSSLASGNL